MRYSFVLAISFLSTFFLSIQTSSAKEISVGTRLPKDFNPVSDSFYSYIEAESSSWYQAIHNAENKAKPYDALETTAISLPGQLTDDIRKSAIDTVPFDSTSTQDTVLGKKVHVIDRVIVLGLTNAEQINRTSFNVTSLDAKSFYNTSLNVANVLSRASGIRLRQKGGLGSEIDLSINGLSGKHVKLFVDGLPMEGFGSSFQYNNIPIHLAERIDVYRGVVPVWLGSDALGGAINLVTKSRTGTYLDASYSFGSFNTHRSYLNAVHTTDKGFTLQLNAYQNYSDNNYSFWLENRYLPIGGEGETKVRRFHDQYRNESIIAKVGFVNKPFADRLLLGIQLGQTYNEVQTGARIQAVYGDYHRRSKLISPSLRYVKKNLFTENLSLDLHISFNRSQEQNIDTLDVRYNWLGEPTYGSSTVSGERGLQSLYKFNDNTSLNTATLSYIINDKQSIIVNNVLTSFNRKGEDEKDPERYAGRRYIATKNVAGVQYQNHVSDNLTLDVFGKSFIQKAKYPVSKRDESTSGGMAFLENSSKLHTEYGYGTAISYQVLEQVQVKGSYERSSRMPEIYEIYGDMIFRVPNYDLKPENSNNVNLGISYFPKYADDHKFYGNINLIYRHSKDFIRDRLDNQWADMRKSENIASVESKGVDGNITYRFKDRFKTGINLTYQDIRNTQKYEDGSSEISIVYRDRLPNIPYLFGNLDISYYIHDLLGTGSTISLEYFNTYVQRMYLFWPSQGSVETKYEIPAQMSHDLTVNYSYKKRYHLGLEAKNITNGRLYDNFSLPKAGRAFNIILRYSM